jgi:hypothetical protein
VVRFRYFPGPRARGRKSDALSINSMYAFSSSGFLGNSRDRSASTAKPGCVSPFSSWHSVIVDTFELIADARSWSEGLPSALISRDQCKEQRGKLRKTGLLRTKLSSGLAWSFSRLAQSELSAPHPTPRMVLGGHNAVAKVSERDPLAFPEFIYPIVHSVRAIFLGIQSRC